MSSSLRTMMLRRQPAPLLLLFAICPHHHLRTTTAFSSSFFTRTALSSNHPTFNRHFHERLQLLSQLSSSSTPSSCNDLPNECESTLKDETTTPSHVSRGLLSSLTKLFALLSFVATAFVLIASSSTLPADAIVSPQDAPPAQQGLSVVTQSDFGKSIRSSVIGGAQLVDRLDQKWERLSDSLRDQAQCDPRTGRRMFDNGKRQDGTPIGNPVLGALCTPEPLADLDSATAKTVLNAAQDAAIATWKLEESAVQKKQVQVRELVGPSFSRAISSSLGKDDDDDVGSGESSFSEAVKRQTFNRDLYTQQRALGELAKLSTSDSKNKDGTERVLAFERAWGDRLLSKFAANANRDDYKSPFPKPDDKESEPYDEGALLDALGRVSAALDKLQQGGIVGHWEISIPENDDWNVVTIAVDDDISLGGQMLAKERHQPLAGSAIVALVRSAMDNTTPTKISYKMNTFFIDPSTTRQELYQPTQLLISLSDLEQ